MMKKISLLTLLALAVLVLSYFFFIQKETSITSEKEIETVFVSAKEILATDVVIKIGDKTFTPNELSAKKGQRIVFLNDSLNYAWPASNPHPTHTNFPEFDPELPMKVGEAWVYTFNKIGDFEYHDHLDPSKRGVIHVVE